MKNDIRFVPWTMYDFVSFSLFKFTLVIKLRNFDFESHLNTSIFFVKDDAASDLNMSHRKCVILFHFDCLGSL